MSRSTTFVVRLKLLAALVVALSATTSAAVVFQLGGPDSSKLALAKASSARAGFLATLSSYGVENLESLSGANPTLTFGASGVTAQTGFANGVQSLFTYSVSGNNFLWDTEGVDDWLQFSQPVTAFGSYVVQSGDGASAPPASTPPNVFSLRLENTAAGTSKEVVIGPLGPDWPFYNVIFIGVTDSQPFDRISFHESFDRDGMLWDDLVAGFVKPELTGDFNSDGIVSGGDVAVWDGNFGAEEGLPNSPGDANGDGVVDGNDILVWQQRRYGVAWPGAAVAATGAVPEPTALALLLSMLPAAVFHGAKNRAQA